MYYVSKRFEVAGAHYVTTEHRSKCEELHGHNWIVIVHCKSMELNDDGMVTDFTMIKKNIMTIKISMRFSLSVRRQKTLQNGFATRLKTATRSKSGSRKTTRLSTKKTRDQKFGLASGNWPRSGET